MYRFYINNIDNDYHYGELARVFLAEDEFEVIPVKISSPDLPLRSGSYLVNGSGSSDRDTIKRELYHLLSELTGMSSEWGTLTGVRPLKLAFELINEAGGTEGMTDLLRKRYLVSESKAELLKEIADYQISNLSGNPSEASGLYVGIPFCPTRCEYCAFASNVAGPEAIAEYFNNLLKEISYTGRLARDNNTRIESV